ncbi:MAG: PIN domain-containing protein [Desulfamplus sp.]|nr:PIN domain-containing protein [Desulfamplus sp.]
MSDGFVADTMAIVLMLEQRKLPKRIRQIFEEAERGNTYLYIPAIALAEIGYLSQRNRIDINLKTVIDYCLIHKTIEIMPLTYEIIIKSFDIDDIPELHDRLIAGTAANIGLTLLTNDPVIANSRHLSTIWDNSD